MTANASKVQFVCTDRGRHPLRSLGWLDLYQPRGARLVRGFTRRSTHYYDDGSSVLIHADATVAPNARGGWTYFLKCPTCGRENRIPDLQAGRFAAARPGQRMGGTDSATRLDISQI